MKVNIKKVTCRSSGLNRIHNYNKSTKTIILKLLTTVITESSFISIPDPCPLCSVETPWAYIYKYILRNPILFKKKLHAIWPLSDFGANCTSLNCLFGFLCIFGRGGMHLVLLHSPVDLHCRRQRFMVDFFTKV